VIARVHPALDGTGPALVHADAYRLGSRAEVDDLDLDADLDTSVTVVEWGEGLVEDLADSYLEITITMERSAAGTGDGGSGRDALDEPRAVRFAARGRRWAEAAESARLALVEGADVL
jgi:tRNA threonylcarbamoyladenosine biosynthesis protein TsaE